MLHHSRRTWATGVLFAATSAVHLGAQLTGATRLADVTQWFLMPLLALVVVMATGDRRSDRLVRLTVLALAFSWLGDTAPDLAPSAASFLVMVGLFLVAQVVYIVAFGPTWSRSVLGRHRLAAIPYAIVVVALIAACARGAGALLVPTIVYAGCLATMAMLSTGVNRWVGIGGSVFLVSDSLIALDAFTSWYSVSLQGFWVMLTYLVGQTLIAVGVVRQVRAAG
jgi:uncharacterized membrane protein YhhN